jgi:methionine-R-sulfoxide reductase
MKTLFLIGLLALTVSSVSCQTKSDNQSKTSTTIPMSTSYNKTDAEWKKQLTEEQYNVLREKGTERPFTGKYNMHFEKGVYKCAGCGYELFDDIQKFESHCGWPSFDGELGEGSHIKKIKDMSFGMVRTEIVCARCGGHLGHIFDDGPTKTGQRYCVNSLSIDFVPASDTSKTK